MLVSSCLQHWYTSVIFFAPVPIVGFIVWLNGRRHDSGDGGPDSRDQARA